MHAILSYDCVRTLFFFANLVNFPFLCTLSYRDSCCGIDDGKPDHVRGRSDKDKREIV